MAAGIASIEYVHGIGATPARVNRKNGHLQINMDVWPNLKPEHKAFVLLHEEGHVVLNTSNELAVDEYAFKKYAEKGYSLTESVKALTQVLNAKSPDHTKRAYLQLQRALEYDNKTNNNKAAYRPQYAGISQIKKTNMIPVIAQLNTASQYDGLFGLSKKEKAKKAEKQVFKKEKRAIKLEKKRTAVDNKKARGERVRSKNQQRQTLAEIGQSEGGQIAGGIGGLVGTVASIFGKKEAEPTPMETVMADNKELAPNVRMMAADKELPAEKMAHKEDDSEEVKPLNTGGHKKEKPPKEKKPEEKTREEKSSTAIIIVGAVAAVLVIVFIVMSKKKIKW